MPDYDDPENYTDPTDPRSTSTPRTATLISMQDSHVAGEIGQAAQNPCPLADVD